MTSIAETKALLKALQKAAGDVVLESHDIARYNGYLTAKFPDGSHRTFRIKTAGSMSALAGKRIVGYLRGRDNTRDYLDFGFVNTDENGVASVSVWKRCQILRATQDYADLLSHPENYPEVEWSFSVSCRRCGRALTVPSSIEMGLGPECASKEAW